jgi:flavin reductase
VTIPEHDPSAQSAFRTAMGSFATGVTVATCVHEGVDHAMTASAVMSVSLDPQLIALSVARTARFWDAIRRQRYWALSVLGEDAQAHAAWLATRGRPLLGQLDRVPHTRGRHGIALINDALAWLECETVERIPAGDHDLMIGRVDMARTGPAAGPLLYWQSHYRQL